MRQWVRWKRRHIHLQWALFSAPWGLKIFNRWWSSLATARASLAASKKIGFPYPDKGEKQHSCQRKSWPCNQTRRHTLRRRKFACRITENNQWNRNKCDQRKFKKIDLNTHNSSMHTIYIFITMHVVLPVAYNFPVSASTISAVAIPVERPTWFVTPNAWIWRFCGMDLIMFTLYSSVV